MIGQTDLINRLETQYEEECLPRFLIFVGAEGMGKRTLMREFAHEHWKLVEELPDVKVDTIRQMIADAYKLSSPTAYIIPDAHKMSVNARNAILKVTEEPPNKATFLMSVVSLEQTLATIKSRGTAYHMRPYSLSEKEEYLDLLDVSLDKQEREFVLDVSVTMQEIERLVSSDPGEFQKYVNKLIDNIASVTVANALKTGNVIAFKDDGEGYDLMLLWKMCCYNLSHRIAEEPQKGKLYLDLMKETMARMSDILTVASISKSNCYDTWVLNCRKIVKEYEDGLENSKRSNKDR